MAVGAAGTHAGGGDLARLASLFLLIHAAATIGLVAVATAKPNGTGLAIVAGLALAAGASLFSGDLAFASFAGHHLVPGAAPAGGMLLLAGWALVAIAAFRLPAQDR